MNKLIIKIRAFISKMENNLNNIKDFMKNHES